MYKEKPEKEHTPIVISARRDDSKLYKLVFNIANTCNLRCMYCYASCGNYGRNNSLMSKEVANLEINKLIDKYKEIKTVYFFGGEPTINFSLIKYIVRTLNQHYKINDYRIVTNGTLINREMLQFFVENDFKVYISIDGPEFINNHLRGDYYKKLINAINTAKNSKLNSKLELICTYTKFHQDNISMDELIKFFDDLNVKYSISDVITENKSLKIEKTDKSVLEQEKIFIENSLKRILNTSLNVGISAYVRNVLDAIILKSQSKYFCNELVNDYSKVIDFNGDIYPCIRLIGNKDIDKLTIDRVNKKSDKKCINCWAYNFCHACTADMLLGYIEQPFKKKRCVKKVLYDFTFNKLLEMYDTSPNDFNKLVKSFYTYYLF